MKKELIRLTDISKSFGANRVLEGISLSIDEGVCYAIVGENGAGKSTLMKIIGGVHSSDTGQVFFEGTETKLRSPSDAIKAGVGTVYQELSLAGNLSIAQNVFCHREPVNRMGFIQWKKLYADAAGIFGQMGVDLDPRTKCGRLSVGMQQIVEIAKALSLNSKVIIMDEPTSALSEKEVDYLYGIVETLKIRNVAVIFISHKLNEVFRIAEKILVLRDGKITGDLFAKDTNRDQIISLMVGRDLGELYPPRSSGFGEEFFRIENLSSQDVFQDVSFSLKKKEILGFAGLVGAGRTEVARAIFGADPVTSGSIWLNGKQLHIRKPSDAIREGIGYLTEDRKGLGLFLPMKVSYNIVASSLERFVSRFGFFRFLGIKAEARKHIDYMQIRPFNEELAVVNLSGGNQQKTLLARWLCASPKVLIVDEPTRGVDIGAKVKIHQDLRKLAEEGVGVIVISSELPEVLGLADRVAVFCEGHLTKILVNDGLTQEDVMKYATK